MADIAGMSTTPAKPQHIFTASDLAKFCQVDLKTIHNWANSGRIEFFRTPGRHLRFKATPVRNFLDAYGYDVPDDVRSAAESSPPVA